MVTIFFVVVKRSLIIYFPKIAFYFLPEAELAKDLTYQLTFVSSSVIADHLKSFYSLTRASK